MTHARNMLEFQTVFTMARDHMDRVAALTDRCLQAQGAPVRVVDVGCGTGDLVVKIAERHPSARVLGIDIARANVREAERRIAAAGIEGRVTVLCGDYLTTPLETADVLIAYSTLQYIPCATRDLCAKLALDVRPGGLLVLGLPVDGWRNRLWDAGRRVLRAVRPPIIPHLTWALARIVSPRMAPELVAQRVPYLYVRTYRFAGSELDEELRAHGFTHLRDEPDPPTRWTRMTHTTSIYRNEGVQG